MNVSRRLRLAIGIVSLAVFGTLGAGRAGAADPAGAWRWEGAIAAFEAADRERPPPRQGVVFVGSSSIRLWDVAAAFPGLPVANRGFGGALVADVTRSVPRIVVPRDPRVVVFYGGDNDLAAGARPDRVVADIRGFVKAVRGRLPDATILLLSVKPSPARRKLLGAQREVNRSLERLASEETGVGYVDVATPLLDRDGEPREELFVRDGLHLGDRGYAAWNEILAPRLRDVLK